MWQVDINLEDNVVLDQHTDSAAREQAAQACSIGLQLEIPTLLDEMDDQVELAYAALPDRLYLIAADGRVAFHGNAGPFGFKADELESAIVAELQSEG